MRILCLADDCAWPEKSGYKIRLANAVRALASMGDVDLFLRIPHDHTGEFDVPDDVGVERWHMVRGNPPRSTPGMLARWLTTRLPRQLARADWSNARRELEEWAEGSYQLVWYGHADSFVELGGIVDAPAIVDLDNLEDQRIRHLREARARDRRAGRRDQIRSRSRALAARAFDRVDERRWAALQRRIARAAAVVAVCSEPDRAMLGAASGVVLPNAYEPRADASPAPTLRPPREHGPVMVMVGLLTYEPNADAAWFLADDVLPVVLAEEPGARLRLVGRYDEFVAPLAARAAIELRGEVPDVGVELARSDVAMVPIRFGAGTRIKVLEAFARRIPVVSTTVGCEGIDVVDGEHLLVADTGDDLASAVLRLWRDPALRARLVEAAYQRWSSRYRASNMRGVVEGMVTRACRGISS
jgi:glycosyltransferase involved in cell wall biosynthesis